MQIVLPDGRQTWVWKGGYNLYVQERLKVRIAERLGEDSIYSVVERLADKNIEPQINRVGVVEQFNALVSSKPVPTLAAKDTETNPVLVAVGEDDLAPAAPEPDITPIPAPTPAESPLSEQSGATGQETPSAAV